MVHISKHILGLKSSSRKSQIVKKAPKGFPKLRSKGRSRIPWEDKLQTELQQRLVEATERLDLEDKVENSWREIKRYQDTLAQSQEQLQSAQMMIEETHERSEATHEKYVCVKRMLRKYEILYRLVTTQLQQRDESYKNYIKSLLSHNVVHTLPSLHRILKKQPVMKKKDYNDNKYGYNV